jgi:hypothetical protein
LAEIQRYLVGQFTQATRVPDRDQAPIALPPAGLAGTARRDPEHDRVLGSAQAPSEPDLVRVAGALENELYSEVARRAGA